MYMVQRGSIKEFEWDEGNIIKSYEKHGVTPKESEEIFLDEGLQVIPDVKHSQKEQRFIVIGKTFSVKVLFVVFTVRLAKIRIISARRANRKERNRYEKAEKDTTI